MVRVEPSTGNDQMFFSKSELVHSQLCYRCLPIDKLVAMLSILAVRGILRKPKTTVESQHKKYGTRGIVKFIILGTKQPHHKPTIFTQPTIIIV